MPEYRVPTFFPLRVNEIAFAEGPVLVESFYAVGDGSYSRSNTVLAGTGAFGLALGVATIAGSAIGNASRRARAAAAATPMWRPVVSGSIVVTSQGFYLFGQTGKYDWVWAGIELMQVAGFSCVVMQGQTTAGPVTWRITSDWAELVFVLWAMTRHPQHPQLVDQSWIPPGWVRWAEEQGYRPHLPERPALTD
ncbi:hypothetical protein [Arthrobacter bambusae]|uniref:hypothetical protein n=1 Tax=Arthrobacter bambusae TaxID=1338426 RepID=UPI002780B717|nr:hypothetical protein [Arthrobacter bambusae]MDQ0212566.1 hypothetical protein [Arthrobacter bambusae]MDQ0236948.1 hypothetical protein [Arthrobacter bambusae]